MNDNRLERPRRLLGEFREFVSRGNVMDMAVGIIVGSAFTAIVNSLVNDLIMPVIGMLTGGIDFSGLKWVLSPAQGDVAEVAVRYGAFLQQVVDFLIIALVVFLMVKAINTLHRRQEKLAKAKAEAEAKPEPQPTAEELQLETLREIRDLIKRQ